MTATMSHKTVDTSVICSWLGIPPEQWPPDHYALLGLPPGESNASRIEEHVHQRLERIRHYQLTHAETATEAMNRLAQAFVCLTDPQAKRAYDRNLLGELPADEPPPEKPPAVKAPPAVPPPEETGPVAAWLNDSPIVRPATPPSALQRTVLDLTPTQAVARVPAAEGPPADAEVGDPELLDLVEEGAPPPAAPPAAPPEPVDPAFEAARTRPARLGLGTKRALYYRVARTRSLLRAWEMVGKYLNHPTRKLSRPAEAREFIDWLADIRRLLEGFPPLLGEAGQPGYLVVTLTRQPVIVPTFQTLLPSQRESLARDWVAGHKLLAAHKDFLRQELRILRRKTVLGRGLRAGRAFLNEHPGGLLILLALLALAIALLRESI